VEAPSQSDYHSARDPTQRKRQANIQTAKNIIQAVDNFIPDINRNGGYSRFKLRVCLARRNYPILQDLRSTAPVQVHEHNNKDIEVYLTDKLESTLGDWMIQSLIWRASGVFIWACFVARRILDRISEHDGLETT